MRARFLTLIYLFIAVCSVSAQNYSEIFLAADTAVFPGKARMKMRMTNFAKNRERETYEFTCYLNGQNEYLLVYERPAPIYGTLQLRKADVIYQYSKKINKVFRISAESLFLNTAFTQEDIMNSTLSALYEVGEGEEVDYEGGAFYRIVLSPRGQNSAYKSIIVFIDIESGLLARREYYSYTDELIKDLVIEDVELSNGVVSRIECTVNSKIDSGTGTRVVFYDIDPEYKMIDAMFDPHRLQYLQ